jgi:hypothetical protein
MGMTLIGRRVACAIHAASIVLATAACSAAQDSTSSSIPSSMQAQVLQAESGLEQPGDVRTLLARILKDNEQMKPLLDALHPQEWYDRKGASSTYIRQWQMAQQQLQDVITSARQFSQKTEDLTLGLDTYFRIEALEVTARSLGEGARAYDSRANADKLQQLIVHNFNSRERLRDYLRELAINLQQNFKIADEEAQRCRAALSTSTHSAKSRR